MKLEQSLSVDSPEIFPSRNLSSRVSSGIKISIMDFSQTRTGSHKGIKARHGLDYVRRKGGDYALIITSGNAGPAFDMVSRDDRYNIQVVKCVNKGIMRKPINITDFGQNRQGITIRLPDKWFNSKQLVKFWRKLVKGKIVKYRNDKEFDKLIEVIKKRGLNPLNAFDVTNIRSYDRKGKSPYSLISEIKYAVKKYDYIFIPFGSGELFTGFQEAVNKLWFSKPVLLAVTTYEHPVSLVKQKKSVNGVRLRRKYRKSHADKLDVSRVGEEHRRSIAMANKRTYFCSLPDELIDKAYKSMGLVKKEYPGLRTTPTGSICLGVLNREHVRSLDGRKGVEVKNTYRFDPMEFEFCKKKLVMKPLVIKPGGRVLVVNTGGLS